MICAANASKFSWNKHWDPFVGMYFDTFYNMWLDASGVWDKKPYAWEVKTTNSWLKPIYPNLEGLDGKTPWAWLHYEKYISDTLIIKIQSEPQIYYFKGNTYKLFKIDTGQYMMAKRKEELAEKKKQDKLRAKIETETMKENEKVQRKIRMQNLKKDCAELGFTDGTEGMGNCVLKLMELENNSAPQVVTTNESPSNDNAMLEIERAKLKAEQERLEVEKQRAWIERQEQLNRIGTQSMEKGWCLMNGGGWGC